MSCASFLLGRSGAPNVPFGPTVKEKSDVGYRWASLSEAPPSTSWGGPSGEWLTRWNTAGVSWVQSPPRLTQSSTCDGDSSVFRSLPPGNAEAPRCAAVFGNSRNVSTPLETPTTATTATTITTTLKVNGENMKNVFLIRTAQIKMWLMLSLNKDYAGTSQRDECLNSFSLVALQWAQMMELKPCQWRLFWNRFVKSKSLHL